MWRCPEVVQLNAVDQAAEDGILLEVMLVMLLPRMPTLASLIVMPPTRSLLASVTAAPLGFVIHGPRRKSLEQERPDLGRLDDVVIAAAQ